MRPGDFSPGNVVFGRFRQKVEESFNEAGGFLPRKHPPEDLRVLVDAVALQ